MKKFNRREQNLLIGTLVVVGVYVIVQFVAKPLFHYASDVKSNIEEAKESLNRNQQIVQKAKDQQKGNQQLMQVFGAAVHTKEETFKALSTSVESSARDANVSLMNVVTKKDFDQSLLHIYPLEAEIEGKWVDIHRFLYTLQSSPNSLIINELALQKKTDNADLIHGRIVVYKESFISK